MPIRTLLSAAALILLLGLAGAGLSLSQEPSTTNFDGQSASAASKFQFQGAGSCAAAACHNGDAHASGRREYALALERDHADPWRVKDRHAQAYEVLFRPLPDD